MALFKFLSVNTLFLAALYAGFVEGMDGARNAALFYAWLVIIVSWSSHSEAAIRAIAESKKPTLPPAITMPAGCAAVALMAWHGAFITAGLYLLALFLFQGAKERAAKLKDGEGEVVVLK